MVACRPDKDVGAGDGRVTGTGDGAVIRARDGAVTGTWDRAPIETRDGAVSVAVDGSLIGGPDAATGPRTRYAGVMATDVAVVPWTTALNLPGPLATTATSPS
jgi:hypothetical protein